MTTSPGQPDALLGRRFGSYVVSRKLGEGGMGAVYELVHPQIGKKQALKVLHAEYAKKTSIVERFFAEAKSVVTIGHPNIVDITDFATLEDGTSYIVMEFLEGQSLASYVKQRGPMSAGEMAAIVLPICDALGAAHAHGIVHRDLKPENVHLVPRPDNPRYVKVLDFGIAKLATPDAAAGPMTKTGQVMGTPTYMSPEQAMGRTREIDHRTDIYALGVLMYQLLSGEVPFQAESFGDLMLMHLSQPPPPLSTRRPDLAPAWDAIIQRALAKNRDERFASMHEVSDAIRGALAGAPSAMIPTVAMQGAGSASYPSMGTQPGQVAYAQGTGAASRPPRPSYPPHASQAPPPAHPSQPSWPPASGESTPVTAPPTGKRKSPALFIALGVIGVGTAIAVALIATSGGKKPATPIAVAPSDAAAVAVASPPDAAAAVAALPPDAAAAVAMVTPDAAPPAAPPPDAAQVAVAQPKKPQPKKPPDKLPDVPLVDVGHPVHCRHPRGQPCPPEKDATGGAITGEKARVRVTAVPWGNVFVDGKAAGQTPVIIDIPAGKPVKVRVVNPELSADQTQTVIVDANQTRAVRFTFGGGD